jgi:hypothetical protein
VVEVEVDHLVVEVEQVDFEVELVFQLLLQHHTQLQ